MSARFIVWVVLLVVGCIWMFKRPLVAVCLNMVFYPINPSLWGTGLESVRFPFIASLCVLLSYLLYRRSLQKPNSEDARPLVLLILYTVWSVVGCTWAVASVQEARRTLLEALKLDPVNRKALVPMVEILLGLAHKSERPR